jgi:hypothetical protein
LNILEDVSPEVVVESVRVPSIQPQNDAEPKKEKRVHFLQDDLFSEMEALKKKMENIDSKIDELFSFCKNIFQQKSREESKIFENTDLPEPQGNIIIQT